MIKDIALIVAIVGGLMIIFYWTTFRHDPRIKKIFALIMGGSIALYLILFFVNKVAEAA